MCEQTKELCKKRSTTQDRREAFYPTPQNQIKLTKAVQERREQGFIVSRNGFINDAIDHYIATLNSGKKK